MYMQKCALYQFTDVVKKKNYFISEGTLEFALLRVSCGLIFLPPFTNN